MAKIKGSRTEINILTAFAGESQVRNRYDLSAERARKDGFVKIAAIFEESALQEKAHAARLFKFLEGGLLNVRTAFPAGFDGGLKEQLAAAAAGEHYEWSELYPSFAYVAAEEGFVDIAEALRSIAEAEKLHEIVFRAYLERLQSGYMFKSRNGEPVRWRCLNCGFIQEGRQAPMICPACAYPLSYFEELQTV